MLLRMACSACAFIIPIIWGPAFLHAQFPKRQEEPSFKDRWKLELLPADLPRSDELTDTFWVQRHAANILGQSTNFAISFPRPADDRREILPHEQPRIHIGLIRIGGASGSHEVTAKYPFNVHGPILEYGGQVRSYCFVKNDFFLLDAVIKVAPKKWYRLTSQLTGVNGILSPMGGAMTPQLADDVAIEELLIEFEQDPFTVEKGRATIHRNNRNLSEKSGQLLHFPTTFSVARDVRASTDLQFRGISHDATHVEITVSGTKLVILGRTGSCAMVFDYSSPAPTGLFKPWEKPTPR